MTFRLTFTHGLALASTALALGLAACGGGGSSSSGTPSSSALAAASTGAVTAFGSVFVNGHEFNTDHASTMDDDTGLNGTGTGALDVGMVVTVQPTTTSTTAAPVANVIHYRPLVRGYITASDSTAGTVTLLGQTIDLTSSTVFVDHRACVTAATSPCTAITSQSGLSAGSGTSGSYVGVHGYLLASGGSAQIAATLVSVHDTPSTTVPYKLEGVVSAIPGTASYTVGAMTLNLSSATCNAAGQSVACASLAKVGDVIAVHDTTAPGTATWAPIHARNINQLTVSSGEKVELEGKVTQVSGTSFVVQGITVDGSALSSLPAVGDIVEVSGTVAAGGTSVTATSLTVEHAAAAANYQLYGPLSNVSVGTTTNTYTVTVLGQTAAVSPQTHISDHSNRTHAAFNITNFKSYLDAKTSTVTVVLGTTVDSANQLRVTSFDVQPTPAGSVVWAGIAGPADGTPNTSGSPLTVNVHGVTLDYVTTMAISTPQGTITMPVPSVSTIQTGTLVIGAGNLLSGNVIDTTVRGGSIIVPGAGRGGDRGH